MLVRFFVTGHGRSGTMWLAHLLNECNPNIDVSHEPLGGYDRANYARVYHGRQSGRIYLDGRVPSMEQLAGGRDWAEVNSYLRYSVAALRERFGAPVAGLVRDGRYVVRSMLASGAYGRQGYPEVNAPNELEDAFAKCCWYWAETYRIFERLIVPVYPLETLNREYEVFVRLCQYLSIDSDQEVWDRYAGKRINATVADETLPTWGPAQTDTFDRLAGDVQRRLYEDG